MNSDLEQNIVRAESEQRDKDFSPDSALELRATEENILSEVGNEKDVEVYKGGIDKVEKLINYAVTSRDKLIEDLQDLRKKLHGEDISHDAPDPSVVAYEAVLDQLETEKVQAQANYPGDWTLLLRDRFSNPKNIAVFNNIKANVSETMKNGRPGTGENPKDFKSHYRYQLKDQDKILDRVFSETNIGYTEEQRSVFGNGRGSIDNPGWVHIDAQKPDGTKLNNRQMNILESHEKGHGLRDFVSPAEKKFFEDAFDVENIASSYKPKSPTDAPAEEVLEYISRPEEIAERISQLKNYFGFSADEQLTKKHIEYARTHYVKDTGYDNSMTVFFMGITPSKIDAFLELVNLYPL